MRDLKFRAWHPEWDEMIYSTSEEPEFCKRAFMPIVFDVGFSGYPQDDEWQIMQFTGLCDKNDKGIYEGDILNVRLEGVILVDGAPTKGYSYEPMTVKFVTDGQLGRFVVIDRCGDIWSGLSNTEIEVIGNIYENPSLMGVDA